MVLERCMPMLSLHGQNGNKASCNEPTMVEGSGLITGRRTPKVSPE